MPKSYGDQFREAMRCRTIKGAHRWLLKEIECYRQEFNMEPPKALSVIKSNLGYMAGYYDSKTAEKVYRLFGANHPIFGGPGYHERVTPKEAFEKGRKMAMRKNKS